jgi:CRP-like cAMP-binding protein
MSLDTPQLPALGILANLDQDDAKDFAAYGAFKSVDAGTVIIEQGQSHGKLFVIISGILEARRTNQGDNILLGQLQAGEWMGEVDLFDPLEAVCSVVSIEESQYWVITRENLEEFINNHPASGILLLIGLATTLSRRIRDVTRKFVEQTELNKNPRISL